MGQSLGKWIGQTISSLRATSTFPALTAPSVIALLCPLEALAQDSPQPADALIVTAAYTGEVNSVLHGGVSSASHYLDNLDLQAEADLEQLLGWQGARAFAYGLYNNGAAFSPAVGDAFVTSNIETGTQALRLYELWLEQQLAPGASVRIGLYDLNSEFDALDASAMFLASAHGIGVDISQSGLNGPSIFPSTSVAARLAIAVDRDWQLRLAVLDGVPGDPDHPARTAVQLGNGDGALLIGEVERHLDAGKVLAGHWRYTGGFDRFDGTRSHGNHGYYLRGDWTSDATVLDPASIDWTAVADGRIEARVRQRPGPNNSMGAMKFEFPNDRGIYLHDTPDRQLFAQAERTFSSGCVRLEDAGRLGRWLLGRKAAATSSQPELHVALPTPVPVFLTYLTVRPGADGTLAYAPDVYGLDSAAEGQLAAAN